MIYESHKPYANRLAGVRMIGMGALRPSAPIGRRSEPARVRDVAREPVISS
jgi:hypothetical protein